MKYAVLALLFACNPSPTKATSDPATTPSASTAKEAGPAGKEGVPHVVMLFAAADSDALSLIRTKRLEAKSDSRVLVVYVSATWCEPCKKLKGELEAGHLDERLSKITFLIFDADKDGDRLRAAGYAFNFVPFVALPGADGHPTDTQQATGKGNDAWRELLGKLDTWQRS